MESFISLVAGGIIGFLASIAKEYVIENKKEKIRIKNFKREKLEEIFILIGDVYSNCLKPLEKKTNINGQQIGVIIRFYFNSLLKDYQTFLKKSMIVMEKTTIPNSERLSQEELQEFYKEYMNILNKIENESKKYI
ncbi:MAG: hypothetical protein PHS65_07035 [Arcobacteraceae bacterium]|nr:hypothetical protein [Arcobacteraceae bacterium]